jgi:tagatose-1,6-bisphosphate aldolase non-catalytic subunit AgaZ/GatZ
VEAPLVTRITEIVQRIIALRERGIQVTLLAACPNSDAVLEASVKAAAINNAPMLFAATLNQVDRDGGYTGWTAQAFVDRLSELAQKHSCAVPLYPCLDHGGPWLKDAHTRAGLGLEDTMAEVKASLEACLEAGYGLLHVDPTVDRTLPRGQGLSIEVVVERTAELIAHAERARGRLALPPVSYEVGTEEVHGGLVDMANFERFLSGLGSRLAELGLADAWPCFIVGKVGTDLHTSDFDPASARALYQRVAPLGSLVKGHYTDWVANPADYPATGMGGANVGPEFTATELAALRELCAREAELVSQGAGRQLSGFERDLRAAVIESDRWRKWLTPDEELTVASEPGFDALALERQEWLVATGARYVWTHPRVLAARGRLYDNLRGEIADANGFVVDRIAANIQTYIDAFNLRDSVSLLAYG